MKIRSSAFNDGERIPKKHTCDGEDVSPPLTWEDVPEGTVTLAIISDDPDAPSKTWTHWLIFNIPPELNGLPEGVEKVGELENGIKQGFNDWAYRIWSPMPPFCVHRYYSLYALTDLNLDAGHPRGALSRAMDGHIIKKKEMIGLIFKRLIVLTLSWGFLQVHSHILWACRRLSRLVAFLRR